MSSCFLKSSLSLCYVVIFNANYIRISYLKVLKQSRKPDAELNHHPQLHSTFRKHARKKDKKTEQINWNKSKLRIEVNTRIGKILLHNLTFIVGMQNLKDSWSIL